MKWNSIKTRDDMPKDRQFLAFWRGCIGLCEYDEDDDVFWFCNQPASYNQAFKVIPEREGKFSHWCDLQKPEDY